MNFKRPVVGEGLLKASFENRRLAAITDYFLHRAAFRASLFRTLVLVG
jgi:hypothetical protein